MVVAGLETWFLSLLLVFTRMSTCFVTMPLWSYQNVPVVYRIGLSVILTWLAGSQLATNTTVVLDGAFVLLVIKEALVGLLLGFVASLIFSAIQIAGAMIDLQMGFAMANLVDPQSGVPMPVTSNLKLLLAMLFFLAIDGHHQLIRGVLASYQLIPLGQADFLGVEMTADWLARFFAQSFFIALQISAPMAAALFLVDLAIGIIARTVPQMNFFVIGFPLKMLFGIAVMLLVIPGFFAVLVWLFQHMFEAMSQVMQRLGS